MKTKTLASLAATTVLAFASWSANADVLHADDVIIDASLCASDGNSCADLEDFVIPGPGGPIVEIWSKTITQICTSRTQAPTCFTLTPRSELEAMGADLFVRSSSAGRDVAINPLTNDENVGVGITVPTAKLHVVGDTIITGDVALGSSRTTKHELALAPQQEILDDLLDLPVYQWKYKADSLQARHVVPMAEDMFERFGLGRDNRHLSPADSAGLALAAIQGLHQRLGKQIVDLRGSNAKLEAENGELKRRLDALERIVFEKAASDALADDPARGPVPGLS